MMRLWLVVANYRNYSKHLATYTVLEDGCDQPLSWSILGHKPVI